MLPTSAGGLAGMQVIVLATQQQHYSVLDDAWRTGKSRAKTS
jgi:hypothetical protein